MQLAIGTRQPFAALCEAPDEEIATWIELLEERNKLYQH